jgi:hypothetical protein
MVSALIIALAIVASAVVLTLWMMGAFMVVDLLEWHSVWLQVFAIAIYVVSTLTFITWVYMKLGGAV